VRRQRENRITRLELFFVGRIEWGAPISSEPGEVLKRLPSFVASALGTSCGCPMLERREANECYRSGASTQGVMSQIFTVLSKLAEARFFPSGLNATRLTTAV
jgi:hypothetical protein